MLTIVIAAGLFVAILAVIAAAILRSVVHVPPETAIVLSGRRTNRVNPESEELEEVGYRIITQGSAFRIPIIERADELSLSQMTLSIDLDDLRDSDGRTRSVSALVNCRISSKHPLIERAMHRFLSMRLQDIQRIVTTTVESRITHEVLAVDLSQPGEWQSLQPRLEIAINEDLAELGVEVDSVEFRRVPKPDPVELPANERGSIRIE